MVQPSWQRITIGYLVTNCCGRGAVVAAYPDALNVLLDDGLLLSFVTHPAQMTALGVLLPELVRSPPAVGASMKRGGGGLRVGSADIPLYGARFWRGRLRRRDLCGSEALGRKSSGLFGGKASLLAQALAARGKPGGFLGLAGSGKTGGPRAGIGGSQRGNPFGAHAAVVLRRAKVAADPPVLHGLEALVGLGPGLTPAGDDFLAGVLLGERALSLQRAGAMQIDSSGIRAMLHRSNPGGRTLLWLALRGSFPAYLLAAVRRIARATTRQAMLKAVEEAAAHGETSGTDALVGLLWYLERAGASGWDARC